MDPIKSGVNGKIWELKEHENSCRKFNLDNLDHYYKCPRQTRDARLAVFDDDEMYFGSGDQQSELYALENREIVEFDEFPGFEKFIKRFMQTLKNLDGTDDPFFDAVIYGAMFQMTNGKILDKIRQKTFLEMVFTVVF